MKKIIRHLVVFAMIISLCLSGCSVAVQAEEPSGLYAKAALLMDAENGRVLYEKSGYDQMAMASTTKIMTCIYTLENGNLDDVVTISKNAVNQPKVRLGMKEGQQYKLKDLLYALMLESYNDCAVAIAEHISGSVEAFCYEMTNKARDLGAHNTSFETPNGLDSKNHYTTCYDLALITKYAIQNEDFLEITNRPSHSFNEIKSGTNRSVNNKDAFLNMFDGAIGVKTGFTNNAGYCFVGAVKQDDRTLISVVLASGWPPNKNYKWTDTRKIMNFGVKDFSIKEVETNIPMNDIPVDRGITKTITPYVDGEYKLLLGKHESLKTTTTVKDILEAPVSKDEIVGTMRIYVGDNCVKEIPIKSGGSSERITYKYCLRKLMLNYFNIKNYI